MLFHVCIVNCKVLNGKKREARINQQCSTQWNSSYNDGNHGVVIKARARCARKWEIKRYYSCYYDCCVWGSFGLENERDAASFSTFPLSTLLYFLQSRFHYVKFTFHSWWKARLSLTCFAIFHRMKIICLIGTREICIKCCATNMQEQMNDSTRKLARELHLP